ncbi:sulfurtransferase [Mechercharimyces sp. CAU 1602]|uniref:sulfurtransferase n=1 Tax=Mechercharimyces sp. CAU 1602 TaxID=2973933 RepID=UPI002162BB07|nr:sulfurtransferase [Mechercharimyces sp. CAU 1602]MCS1351845.1 sulfurtransferase [Mechercharimyces sp. CAU 1602]
MIARIISPQTLYQNLDHPDWVIVDCRFDLEEETEGEREYKQAHIPRAIYMNLERDLSGMEGKVGGRHPLPDLSTFTQLLGECGINHEKHVVIYDNHGGMFAVRLWWMLSYVGHEEVSLLDEGYEGWCQKGYPITEEEPYYEPTTFVPTLQDHMLVERKEVEESIGNQPIIDARAPERFRGEEESLDPRAGHIPGAINHFWKNNLEEGQRWKCEEQLQSEYSYLSSMSEPIVYCGSGVTACANIFAMKRAGIEGARLYVGSWSEWSRNDTLPVERE